MRYKLEGLSLLFPQSPRRLLFWNLLVCLVLLSIQFERLNSLTKSNPSRPQSPQMFCSILFLFLHDSLWYCQSQQSWHHNEIFGSWGLAVVQLLCCSWNRWCLRCERIKHLATWALFSKCWNQVPGIVLRKETYGSKSVKVQSDAVNLLLTKLIQMLLIFFYQRAI